MPKAGEALKDIQTVSNTAIAPAPRSNNGVNDVKPIKARVMDDVRVLSTEAPEAPKAASRGSSSGRRRVNSQKPGNFHIPEWEHGESSEGSRGNDGGSPLPWLIGGGLLGLSILGVGAWLVMGSLGKDSEATAQWVPTENVGNLDDSDTELTSEERQVNQEIQQSVETGTRVIEEARDILTKFTSITDLEEFRSVVRFPDETMPLIKKWYETKPIVGDEIKEVGYGGRVNVDGHMASITLQMADYSLRQVAIEKTADGYRIDWQSWVAWTEIDWDLLFEKRPIEPKTVLVNCVLDSYYNRYFNDDTKWAVIKLTNPQSERTLYGYIDRENLKLMRFVADLAKGAISARLQIQYPEDAVAGEQVIITDHLANGWVIINKETTDSDTE